MYRFRGAIIGLAALLFLICVWGIADTAQNLKENLQWNQNLTATTMEGTPVPTKGGGNETWLPKEKGAIRCQWTHYDYIFYATTCAHGYDKKLSVTIYGEIVVSANSSGLASSCTNSVILRLPEDQDFFCHNSNRSVTDELDLYWPLDQIFDCSVDSYCKEMDYWFSNQTPVPTTPKQGDGGKKKDTGYLIAMIIVLSIVSLLVFVMMVYCVYQAKTERDLDRYLREQLINGQT